jgi:hypothetical protein
MLTTREIAKLSLQRNPDDTISLEIVKEFNHQSLDGILTWSHCWIISVESGEMQMHAFEIHSHSNRFLNLIPLGSTPSGDARIIDIKPMHACDIS